MFDIINAFREKRDFASNVGIPFKTPEELFLGAAHEQITREFDPSVFLDTVSKSQRKESLCHPVVLLPNPFSHTKGR